MIDGQNRRVGKRINGTLIQGFLCADQLNPVAEFDGAGNVVSTFVYGTRPNTPDYLVQEGVTYRAVSDYLGTVHFAARAPTGPRLEPLMLLGLTGVGTVIQMFLGGKER